MREGLRGLYRVSEGLRRLYRVEGWALHTAYRQVQSLGVTEAHF